MRQLLHRNSKSLSTVEFGFSFSEDWCDVETQDFLLGSSKSSPNMELLGAFSTQHYLIEE